MGCSTVVVQDMRVHKRVAGCNKPVPVHNKLVVVGKRDGSNEPGGIARVCKLDGRTAGVELVPRNRNHSKWQVHYSRNLQMLQLLMEQQRRSLRQTAQQQNSSS